MRRKTKHITAILFGLITAFPFLFLMLLEARQLQIKQDARKRLRSGMLQTIAIPVQDVVWEEEGRELIIDGEIFDIDSYHIKDGYLFAAGILDKDETEFVKFLHKQTDESKGTTLFVQWILMSECVMNHFIPSAVPGNNSELQKNITFYIFHYNNPFSTVIIPPPKFHLS